MLPPAAQEQQSIRRLASVHTVNLVQAYQKDLYYVDGSHFDVYKTLLSLTGREVAVKALCYKPAGRGLDSRWCHWNFTVAKSFRSQYGPGVDSASNKNEYQVYFLGVKAAGA